MDSNRPANRRKENPGKPEVESTNTRDFLRIASVSTALGFGCVGAAVTSLRAAPGGYSFQVTPGTFVAFAIGAAAGFFCWKLAARGRTAARMVFILLTVAGLAAFLYPLRFTPRSRLPEIALGLAVATCVVSTGGYLIWRVARFLDDESKRVEHHPSDDTKAE